MRFLRDCYGVHYRAIGERVSFLTKRDYSRGYIRIFINQSNRDFPPGADIIAGDILSSASRCIVVKRSRKGRCVRVLLPIWDGARCYAKRPYHVVAQLETGLHRSLDARRRGVANTLDRNVRTGSFPPLSLF